MDKKHYIANNTKYYKDSNSSEISHVIRSMSNNLNTFSELTKNNFGHSFDNNTLNLKQNYDLKLNEAKNQNSGTIQKHSNTFIDSVLIFDNELIFKILQTPNGQEKINQAIKCYMKDFKEKYGFEPIGFQFHTDEGTFYTQNQHDKLTEQKRKNLISVTNDETGEKGFLKQNFHAHAIFLNFNKETSKTCLRTMRKKDWSNCQDLLYKHFKDYGFNRGEYKQTSSKDHLNKEEYVKKLNSEIELLKMKEVELLKRVKTSVDDLANLQDEIGQVYDDAIRFIDIKESLSNALKALPKNKNLFNFLNINYNKIKNLDFVVVFKKLVFDRFEFSNIELGLDEPEPKIQQDITQNTQKPEPDKEELDSLRLEIKESIQKTKQKNKKITNAQRYYSRKKRP